MPSADASRLGTTYFVPGVRIAKLEPRLRSGDPGILLPQDMLYDVVRVEVQRVNTGASQYSMTLNNWYLATAADRAAVNGASPGLAAGRERLSGSNPYWPRFKYNDFGLIKFGDRLRIDMRYWPDPVSGLDAAAKSAQNWVPMIAGPITDMRFSFATGGGAQIIVSGQDDLSILQDKNEGRFEMSRLAEVSIVRRVLGRAHYPLQEIAHPLVAYPDFATDDSQGLQEALQDGTSCLGYIQKLAERLDFEVFLEFSDLTKPESALEFHFEPWRSRAPINRALRDLFTLHRERNLLEFNPTIRVVDQYSKVRVRGRHRDPQIPQEVTGEATDEIIADELHTASQDGRLFSGPCVRKRFFPGRPNINSIPNQSNLDDVRAQWLAETVIRKKARELFSIDGVTIGLPRLRPGNHVEIRGMRPPFDGFYYVLKTTHTFGGEGFRTKFTAARPGMELPAGSDCVEVGA
jgi:hypothetical protein